MSYEITNLILEKLPSNTYRLSFLKNGNPHEIFYTTKAQLIKVVNHPKTFTAIKDFLKEHLISGKVIK